MELRIRNAVRDHRTVRLLLGWWQPSVEDGRPGTIWRRALCRPGGEQIWRVGEHHEACAENVDGARCARVPLADSGTVRLEAGPGRVGHLCPVPGGGARVEFENRQRHGVRRFLVFRGGELVWRSAWLGPGQREGWRATARLWGLVRNHGEWRDESIDLRSIPFAVFDLDRLCEARLAVYGGGVDSMAIPYRLCLESATPR